MLQKIEAGNVAAMMDQATRLRPHGIEPDNVLVAVESERYIKPGEYAVVQWVRPSGSVNDDEVAVIEVPRGYRLERMRPVDKMTDAEIAAVKGYVAFIVTAPELGSAGEPCCEPWALVMEGARRNRGLVIGDNGTLFWDVSAAGRNDDDDRAARADMEVRFCPFCGKGVTSATVEDYELSCAAALRS